MELNNMNILEKTYLKRGHIKQNETKIFMEQLFQENSSRKKNYSLCTISSSRPILFLSLASAYLKLSREH